MTSRPVPCSSLLSCAALCLAVPWHASKPDAITYTGTISACEKAQQWITATTLLQKMQQLHVKPFKRALKLEGNISLSLSQKKYIYICIYMSD